MALAKFYKMKFSKKTGFISYIVFIFITVIVFYLIRKSIRISDTLEHAENDELIKTLENKQLFIEIFTSIILIIEITVILFIIFLITKYIFKFLKTSITQHQTPNIK